MSVITQKTVKVTITARQESLIIRTEGGDIEAVVVEARRQLDFLVGTHWKWMRFPVVVDLMLEINGEKTKSINFIARKMRELIEQSTVAVEKQIRAN